MTRTVGVLLLLALMLLGAGLFFYSLGSQQNLEVLKAEEVLWAQPPGDKWLYVGGLMILIAGALTTAAVKVLFAGKKGEVISAVGGTRSRE